MEAQKKRFFFFFFFKERLGLLCIRPTSRGKGRGVSPFTSQESRASLRTTGNLIRVPEVVGHSGLSGIPVRKRRAGWQLQCRREGSSTGVRQHCQSLSDSKRHGWFPWTLGGPHVRELSWIVSNTVQYGRLMRQRESAQRSLRRPTRCLRNEEKSKQSTRVA